MSKIHFRYVLVMSHSCNYFDHNFKFKAKSFDSSENYHINKFHYRILQDQARYNTTLSGRQEKVTSRLVIFSNLVFYKDVESELTTTA